MPFGEAVVRRDGADVTIVGILKMANVALEAAETVGDKVVRDIVEHWAERESTIPHAP